MFRVTLVSTLIVAVLGFGAEPQKIDLFEAGKGGYAIYRIPGLVVLPEKTILAYCEARKTAKSDWGRIDILMRRSTDNGVTWDEPRSIANPKGKFAKNPVALAQKLGTEGETTFNNPVMIYDSKTKVVHFLFCVEYMRCFHCLSKDNGKTFSEPVEITAAFDKFRPDYNWKVLATGPTHGIQMTSGRLIVPVWLSTGTGGHAHRPSVVATIYSDDHGKTWDRGAILAKENDPLVNPSETAIVELSDGRIMANIRSESKEHRRAVSISPNGIDNWSKPVFQKELVEPICLGSLIRGKLYLPLESKWENALLFANPANLDVAKGEAKPGTSRVRKNLQLFKSRDDGVTWEKSLVIEPGPSAYSDLATTDDGWLLCFYERGKPDNPNGGPYQLLTLIHINNVP